MQFIVRSQSSGEEYEIVLFKGPGKIALHCSCPAGSTGQHCKHRLALIDGDDSAVIRASHTVDELKDAIMGSEIHSMVERVRAQEALVIAAQAELKKLRKALGRAMIG